MAERRKLGDAMSLTPEKIAFIHGESTPSRQPPSPIVIDSQPDSIESPTESAVESANIISTSRSMRADSPRRTSAQRSTSQRPARSARTEPVVEEGLYGQILVPLTTRLQPKTADALRRACLELKLARRPQSQQEIVEQALSHWLREHEFLQG